MAAMFRMAPPWNRSCNGWFRAGCSWVKDQISMNEVRKAQTAGRRLPGWFGYIAAILIEGAVTGGLLVLYPYLPLGRFPIPYVLAIGVIAYVFGEGPAVLAFLIGIVAFDYFFNPPVYSVWPIAETRLDWAAWIAFIIGTSLVAAGMVLIRWSQHRTRMALLQAEHELAVRRQAEAALEQEQQHRLEFYRRTIEAATEGKLIVCDREDIRRMEVHPLGSWTVKQPEDLSEIRHAIEAAAASAGMDSYRTDNFIVAIGEAATNALKHAGAGTVSLHLRNESLICIIEDKGPGIQALSIPDVALTRGYSTAGTLGMGYKIMISLSDRIYLATGSDGVLIGVEMQLSPAEEQKTLPAQPLRLVPGG